MKIAIAKLMIATMMIDSDIDERENLFIRGIIQILGITDIEYDNLRSEATEIIDEDSFKAWTQPALDTLIERQDHELSNLAVAIMMLVAYADGEIKDVEDKLIQSTASILGIASPTWSDKVWIQNVIKKEVKSNIEKKFPNTDNE